MSKYPFLRRRTKFVELCTIHYFSEVFRHCAKNPWHWHSSSRVHVDIVFRRVAPRLGVFVDPALGTAIFKSGESYGIMLQPLDFAYVCKGHSKYSVFSGAHRSALESGSLRLRPCQNTRTDRREYHPWRREPRLGRARDVRLCWHQM